LGEILQLNKKIAEYTRRLHQVKLNLILKKSTRRLHRIENFKNPQESLINQIHQATPFEVKFNFKKHQASPSNFSLDKPNLFSIKFGKKLKRLLRKKSKHQI
jgi:hypothetical protein